MAAAIPTCLDVWWKAKVPKAQVCRVIVALFKLGATTTQGSHFFHPLSSNPANPSRYLSLDLYLIGILSELDLNLCFFTRTLYMHDLSLLDIAI